MASRFDLLPLLTGHWRGLTMRQYRYDLPESDERSLLISADHLARWLTLLVPAISIGVSALALWGNRPDWNLGKDIAGVILGGAGLLSGGLLAAFSLLAAWRQRLGDAGLRRQRPLRAMIDEAVAHVLLAAVEAALLVGLAMLALVANGWPAKISAMLAAGCGAHVLFLFLLLVPRLYSAYTQTADVEERLDGHTHV